MIEPASVVGLEFSEAAVVALVSESLLRDVPQHLHELNARA